MSKIKASCWNYRLATKIINDERYFGVIEVFYKSHKDAKNNKADSYVDFLSNDKNILGSFENIKEITGILKLVKKEIKKHGDVIYDLDNWPNLYLCKQKQT